MQFEQFKQQLEERKQANANYAKLNRDKKHEWDKAYRESHKEQRREYNKQFQEENKEDIAEKKKQYRQSHKEQIQLYKLDNKEKLAEKAATKINCECGNTHRLGDILRHKRTIHHQAWESVLKD